MRQCQYELRVFTENASGNRSKQVTTLLLLFKGRQVPPGLCE